MASLRRSMPPRGARLPSFEELEEWIGWRVDDVNGSVIGRVERVVGDETGKPAWLVLGEFRLGEGRRFVIPAGDAVGGGGRVWSPHTREHIRATARLSGPKVSLQSDRRLRAHYGRPPRAALALRGS